MIKKIIAPNHDEQLLFDFHFSLRELVTYIASSWLSKVPDSGFTFFL